MLLLIYIYIALRNLLHAIFFFILHGVKDNYTAAILSSIATKKNDDTSIDSAI